MALSIPASARWFPPPGQQKWRGLVTLSARLLEPPAAGKLPPVEIVAPDGETLRGDQQNIDERLSAILGQPVHLAHRVTENNAPVTATSRCIS